MNKQDLKYYIITYGCQMNQGDSERLAAVLEDLGFVPVKHEKEADLIAVVACSVRQSATDRIYGKFRKKNKGGKIWILTGCILKEDKKKLEKVFDLVFDIKKISNLKSQILNKFKICPERSRRITNLKNFSIDYFRIKPNYSTPFSAYVPIMTGCNNFCSYCVVPYTRGREVSRPIKEIIDEVRDLIKKGYKEIILLGQNVNSYANNFVKLLGEINKIPGNFWIRFITSHPKDMSDGLIKAIGKFDKITKYVHLPVQSGDNEILRKMNRNYTVKHYLGLIGKIRKAVPEAAISTDIIVGFPGETREQFNNTAKLMREVGFDMAYIAEYSPRSGTVAAKLVDNVSRKEKQRRKVVLNKILDETALKNNKKLVGRAMEVLVDTIEGNKCYGKTSAFKTVKFLGDKSLLGNFVKVKINKAGAYGLEGRLI
jgi:tRNA-2-methylthio-N6-dimethylallyladenosine synthase